MKTIGAAVFLVFSAHLVLASDSDFPALKYDQREPGSLPSAPASGRNFVRPVLNGSEVEVSGLGGTNLYSVKDGSLPAQQKSTRLISGKVPSSRALDLTLDPIGRRSAPDYSLISREPLKAKAPSESSSVSP